jgi:hypothetical protein
VGDLVSGNLPEALASPATPLQDVINTLGPDNPDFQPSCAAVGPLIGNV